MISNPKILVTGAHGFVGSALCQDLTRRGVRVNAVIRQGSGRDKFLIKDIASQTDWMSPLHGCSAVIHLAARVHVLTDRAVDPLAAFRSVNVQGTLNLARQAAKSGVHRFVFISSIGVNGAVTACEPFSAEDQAQPHSPYAQSKYEAELGLQALAKETGMKVVIIRPPLVYGQNAPGNFGSLMRWLKRGIPLPLGGIHNQRSLVALDNLVDLIITCLTHPSAANQTFLVSDGEDLSTTQLLRRMGAALGKPARLIPVPVSVLKLCAALIGKPELAQRLCGSLQIDMSKTRDLLGWTPPFAVDAGLEKAAKEYSRETAV